MGSMKRTVIVSAAVAVVTAFAAFRAASVRAEAQEVAQAPGITVRVRTIRAAGRVTEPPADEQGKEQAKAARIGKLAVDDGLQDLLSKLRQLPYRNYRLGITRDVVVPVKQKQTVRLNGGQVLNLRLLYAEGAKMGMWIRWTDKHGAALLDTRMHFNRSEPMIAGTDSGEKCGHILALSVLDDK
jgi:hypothetical protein